MADQYFAKKSIDELLPVLGERIDAYDVFIQSSGFFTRYRKSYRAYFGFSTIGNFHQASEVGRAGEGGELSLVKVNDFRNIVQHIVSQVTQQKPSFQAKATNSDYKSQVQSILANGLLEYYMREKHLERKLKQAVEQALIFGEAFISVLWNPTSGKQYSVNPDTGMPVYEGDIEFRNLTPMDVLRDPNKEEHTLCDWIMIREFKNKYDFMAKYPELADQIEAKQFKTEHGIRMNLTMRYDTDTTDIPIYHFYHKRTPSCPDGRYVQFISDDILLFDGNLPYRELPVYRITPGEFYGSVFGYTPAWDLLGLQEVLDALYSAIVTNQTTFATQNILLPRGSGLNYTALSGGLSVLEYDPSVGKPEAMNLTATAPEVFNFIGMLDKKIETIGGINSVVRGNPEASLKSGSALALIASQSIQYMSALQQSYAQLCEDVGTGVVLMLRDFATVPRVAMIAGKHNSAYIKEFSGQDLDQINRVTVDMGNPLARTIAGRLQMADQFLQLGLITPEQYMMILDTGKYEQSIEGKQAELLLIKSENEALSDLENQNPVPTLATDNHLLHKSEHVTILSSPNVRLNPQLVQRVLSHIQQHDQIMAAMQAPLPPLMSPQPQGKEVSQVSSPIPEEEPRMPRMPTNPLTGEQAPQPTPQF